MSEKHTPTEIKLHQKSRILEIGFEDGKNFKLPCEYLRTHAKSAEIETSDIPVSGKADVNIEKIEPQGSYALRLYFTDGYNTGIFSWDSLYELGENQASNWQQYLQRLDKHQLKRDAQEQDENNSNSIKILYFMDNMLRVTRKESEQIELPPAVKDVQGLLKLLRMKGKTWEEMFADDAVQVTVNKHFAEPFTLIENGDEVAIVPTSKDL